MSWKATVAPDSQIEYHLRELEVALDPASPGHVLPDFRQDDRSILDIGCGIGQSLIVSGDDPGCLRVGIDVDMRSLAYGHRHYSHVSYVLASAEALPFRSEAFDLVMSRVALPYTDLRASLSEIARVSAPGGRIWLSLHSFKRVARHLLGSIRAGAWKDVLFRLYAISNGAAFHFFGLQFRFPWKSRCESFQTRSGFRRTLRRLGFIDVSFPQGRHFLCTANKPGRITLTRASASSAA
jgi:ubiquinone/menaquinone biosynthesis C-methylase UbiE